MFGRTKFARGLGVLMLALLALLIYFLGASDLVRIQADEPLDLEGEEVVRYDHSDSEPLVGATRRINAGEKFGEVCKFTDTLELAFGEAGRVVRTLAVNFAACKILVEEGTRVEEDMASGNDESVYESETVHIPPPSSPNQDTSSTENSAVDSSNITRVANIKTAWEDLIQLNVNSLKVVLRWMVNSENDVIHQGGKCVKKWLKLSGWSQGAGTCEGLLETHSAVMEADQEFHNTTFPCALQGNPAINLLGSGADTHYSNNQVTGSSVGATWYSDTFASGDCAYLLHSEKHFGWGG